MARERLFERGVIDEATRDDAGEVLTRPLELFAHDPAVLAKLVESPEDGLLLPRRRLQALEEPSEEPSSRTAANHTPTGSIPMTVAMPATTTPQHLDQPDQANRTENETEHRRTSSQIDAHERRAEAFPSREDT